MSGWIITLLSTVRIVTVISPLTTLRKGHVILPLIIYVFYAAGYALAPLGYVSAYTELAQYVHCTWHLNPIFVTVPYVWTDVVSAAVLKLLLPGVPAVTCWVISSCYNSGVAKVAEKKRREGATLLVLTMVYLACNVGALLHAADMILVAYGWMSLSRVKTVWHGVEGSVVWCVGVGVAGVLNPAVYWLRLEGFGKGCSKIELGGVR